MKYGRVQLHMEAFAYDWCEMKRGHRRFERLAHNIGQCRDCHHFHWVGLARW